MSAFASAKHLASWAGVCPGNNESGGVKRASKITPGNKAVVAHMLRRLLDEARAQGAVPTDVDLARALDISTRTVERDMPLIRARGADAPRAGSPRAGPNCAGWG